VASVSGADDRVVLQKLVEDRKLLGKEVSYAATPKISAMNLTRSGNYSGLKHSNELRESTKEAVRFE
jgi:hypothetical protein